MPELPEVETIRRSLEDKIKGKTFTGIEIFLEKILKGIDAGEFDEKLKGKKITGISRRGKYLIIQLSGGLVMVVHLRMTGQLLYCSAEQERVKHTHVIFHLSDKYDLRFVDQRQFGKVQFLPAKDLENLSSLKNLGVEPLSDDFTREFFKKGLRNRRVKIKPLLLEQEFIAGIGNIYADEALFRARVNPEKVAANLSPREASMLFNAIREVLIEGIDNKGTSIKDYIDGDGNKGSNQNNLRVYGRDRQPCTKCGTEIQRVVIRGRSAHYCPKCQKI
ncbi:DNA-formamidopyrimidine glycosylase [Phosphitispora fastidiosa]|uniref:DNA-formamidopyrimidine glycosylase n=1 Tax=Phosphitispora fastidiosa TaxID=2837202 RepID=UPI001E62EBD5|nr:DNA-formamidopyrimidine glycosylase [Phosphitispora fastidiosa]MBU7006759.1 formamidopyrimidine-DNA glycosylase [Phosphitispora fastidiosa]